MNGTTEPIPGPYNIRNNKQREEMKARREAGGRPYSPQRATDRVSKAESYGKT